MAKIAEHTTGPPPQPLQFQMTMHWEEATAGENNCIERAEECNYAKGQRKTAQQMVQTLRTNPTDQQTTVSPLS